MGCTWGTEGAHKMLAMSATCKSDIDWGETLNWFLETGVGCFEII
jgi:hypothetical protein